MPLNLSQHAAARAQQRGVPHHLIEALITHGDVEASVGGGCSVLRISRERLRDCDVRATLEAQVELLASLAVVWSDFSCEIVTVLHDHGGAAGRRYRRPH